MWLPPTVPSCCERCVWIRLMAVSLLSRAPALSRWVGARDRDWPWTGLWVLAEVLLDIEEMEVLRPPGALMASHLFSWAGTLPMASCSRAGCADITCTASGAIGWVDGGAGESRSETNWPWPASLSAASICRSISPSFMVRDVFRRGADCSWGCTRLVSSTDHSTGY